MLLEHDYWLAKATRQLKAQAGSVVMMYFCLASTVLLSS
jgi:hypothetical protein